MKRGRTQAVLLTLLSSVSAVKIHDAMVITAPTSWAIGEPGDFGGPGSPEQEAKMSSMFEAMDLDSSGDLDLNELGLSSFGEEWKGAHKVELKKQSHKCHAFGKFEPKCGNQFRHSGLPVV